MYISRYDLWRSTVLESPCSSQMRFRKENRFPCFQMLSFDLGSARKALLGLYKSICLPKILYCCSIWGSSVKFKWCSKMLRSAQGPLSFVIAKAFKSTSTVASLVLANILPLDLEVQSWIGFRALTHGTDNLTPSTNVLIKKVAEAAIANVAPDTPNRTKEVKNQMRAHFHREWDSEWKSCVGGETTRRFFPSVFRPEAIITHQPSSMVCQILTGHSYLNYFLSKIKIVDSPLCKWETEPETIEHFLFTCPLYLSSRQNLKQCVAKVGLHWPLELTNFTQSVELWLAFCKFIITTNRLFSPFKLNSMAQLSAGSSAS